MTQPNRQHDHLHLVQRLSSQQVSERLLAAKQQCQLAGVRFTQLRQQIYQLILSASKPVGAYDLITQLQQLRNQHAPINEDEDVKASQKNVAPPTVYRSLEFLLEHGLIHQLNSLNAYVPCCHPRAQHVAAFLICDQCEQVQECSSLPVQEIVNFAKKDVGFKVNQSVIELKGLCQRCQP